MIYPLFYHYSNFGSDRDFVLARMAVIPDNLQQEVSDEYDKLFRSKDPDRRKKANEYLHSIASKYRNKKP